MENLQKTYIGIDISKKNLMWLIMNQRVKKQ